MVTADDLRALPPFAQCSEQHIAYFARSSADVHIAEGEWIIREGETPKFQVLLAGTAEILKTIGGQLIAVGAFTQGDAFGELPLLFGTSSFINVRATSATRWASVDQTVFWRMLHEDEPFARTVLANVAKRVSWIEHVAMEAPRLVCRLEADGRSPACHELRDFMTRMHVQYDWENRESNACDVSFPDGATLHDPTIRELAARLGLSEVPRNTHYDVAIVGAGPAGLAAAVYGASEGLQTLLIERYAPGGQAGMSSRIENYLGFPMGISGDELADRAFHQAQRFGADIVVVREVRSLEGEIGDRRLTLDDGQVVLARAVILAPGVNYRTLPAQGCADFLNRGVYYGAAKTEAPLVSGKDIHILGGGNSAGQAALYLSTYAQTVRIVIRAGNLAKDMSQYLVDRVTHKENIEVLTNREVVAVAGSDRIERLELRNTIDGTTHWEPTDALFVFIGAVPRTDWLDGFVACDERGFIFTGPAAKDADGSWPLERHPHFLETNRPGVFAVGDVRSDSVKRVAAGVGEGSTAIALVNAFLKDYSS